jgi:hypothetical protein
MRTPSWLLAAALVAAATPNAAQADGASSEAGTLNWARWQGRLSLGSTAASSWRVGADSATAKLSSAAVMGDYYFYAKPAGVGDLRGFRATSGLIFGTRRSSLSIAGQPSPLAGSNLSLSSRLYGLSPVYAGDSNAESLSTLPYLGFGYTEFSARSGWSFSADLGMVAQGSSSAARLGRTLGGGQSLDEAVRDMRLAPVVQVGVSYAF